MLRLYFEQYIKVTRGKSARHYITGINSINALLEKYQFPVKDLFAITSQHELDAVKTFLSTNQEFIEKDAIGHNMYSVAFKHFCAFVCEDDTFFSQSITAMDIVVAKPKEITITSKQWRCNQIIITQAVEGAGYLCEHNSEHQTFISKATGHPYMEGHHLIPLKYQSQFSCGIDVYANVVCLCPICHKLLHFGRDSERTTVAEQLFEKRSERLSNSGIDLSKKDFLELVL